METKGTLLSYRPDIRVIDATIRDGGLVNDFRFTDEFVKELYKANIKAGIDYMEFGYKASKEIFDVNEFGPWKFCNEEDIRRIVGDNDSGMKIAVMADVGRTDYKNDIIDKADSVIDLVRIATYINTIPAAIEMAEYCHDKGYETTINIMKKKTADKIAKLPEKVSLDEVDMSAADFNAQYLPTNCINITVAIMQKPMFDPNGDNAENLGALGSIVGHEIGHAFDSTCINYDPDGKYDPSWINEDDKQVLKERADALSKYYSNYTIMEVYHVDGELTNGENYADLSGIECVTNLIDDEEELKKLFKSYAESWCTLEVDTDAISMLKLDPHSPAKTRVNAVLASNKKFNEVYDLKEGDGMYVAPEERVSRW